VIFDSQGRVLIGQRVVKDAYYKKWEFPGGKLEDHESASEALARELQEEIGIQVEESRFLMGHEHNYPDRRVSLSVYIIDKYKGSAVGQEGQALRWVNLEELAELDFLAGNQIIIQRLNSGLN